MRANEAAAAAIETARRRFEPDPTRVDWQENNRNGASRAQHLAMEAAKVQKRADAEKRELTAAELELIDKLCTESNQCMDEFNAESRRLEDARRGRGNGSTGRRGGSGPILIGADGRRLQCLSRDERMADGVDGAEDVDVGRFLHGVITGRHEALSPIELRAMSGGSDSGGGFLLPSAVSAVVVDLARSASVCLRAGASTLPMDGAELSIARLTQDPVGQWRRETVAVTSSLLDFDRVTLRPKTLAAVVPISIELFEDAGNAGSIIQSALSAALGLKLDQAALNGAGSGAEPRGVANEPLVGEVSSVGANMGGDYQKLVSAIGAIFAANYPGDPSALSLILHPRDAESLDSLEDSTGQPLQPTPWTAQLRKFTTTSLPTNLGGGSNESLAVLGDFSQLLFGMRTSGVTIRIVDSGSVTDSAGTTWNATSQLMRLVVAYLRADVCVLRPS